MGSNYGKKTLFCCVHFVFQIYHKLHFQRDHLLIEFTRDRFPWEKRQNKALGAFDVVNDSIIRGFNREPLCPGLARFSCLSNWILSITKRLESRIAERGPWSLGNFKSVTQVRCESGAACCKTEGNVRRRRQRPVAFGWHVAEGRVGALRWPCAHSCCSSTLNFAGTWPWLLAPSTHVVQRNCPLPHEKSFSN